MQATFIDHSRQSPELPSAPGRPSFLTVDGKQTLVKFDPSSDNPLETLTRNVATPVIELLASVCNPSRVGLDKMPPSMTVSRNVSKSSVSEINDMFNPDKGELRACVNIYNSDRVSLTLENKDGGRVEITWGSSQYAHMTPSQIELVKKIKGHSEKYMESCINSFDSGQNTQYSNALLRISKPKEIERLVSNNLDSVLINAADSKNDDYSIFNHFIDQCSLKEPQKSKAREEAYNAAARGVTLITQIKAANLDGYKQKGEKLIGNLKKQLDDIKNCVPEHSQKITVLDTLITQLEKKFNDACIGMSEDKSGVFIGLYDELNLIHTSLTELVNSSLSDNPMYPRLISFNTKIANEIISFCCNVSRIKKLDNRIGDPNAFVYSILIESLLKRNIQTPDKQQELRIQIYKKAAKKYGIRIRKPENQGPMIQNIIGFAVDPKYTRLEIGDPSSARENSLLSSIAVLDFKSYCDLQGL